jgi:antibiotic biosynthesis monooxygenase (ABM) superfamily enzyme
MRAIVQVHHFLTPEGAREFSCVVEQHRLLVSAFPGFVSLSFAGPQNLEADVSVSFASETLLQAWRASASHASVAAAYRQLWSRAPDVAFSKE